MYMVLDEVQLSDSLYQHRNLFLTVDGKAKYLSIPLNKKNYLQQKINELEISNDTWRMKHLNFIKNSYGKYPFRNEVMPMVEDYFSRNYSSLLDSIMESMRLSLELFGIETQVLYQSMMHYDRTLKRGDLILALARAAGADCYLSGTGAKAYLDEGLFGDDIALQYDIFSHPTYPQINANHFIPGLSCLDAVFNLGKNGARQLIGVAQ